MALMYISDYSGHVCQSLQASVNVFENLPLFQLDSIKSPRILQGPSTSHSFFGRALIWLTR